VASNFTLQFSDFTSGKASVTGSWKLSLQDAINLVDVESSVVLLEAEWALELRNCPTYNHAIAPSGNRVEAGKPQDHARGYWQG
jgi:hypothetical protein